MLLDTTFIYFAAVSILLTAIFCFVRVKWGGVWGLFTKILASISFLIAGIYGLSFGQLGTTVKMFIVLGLMFGLLGDILLDLKVMYKKDEGKYLNLGMLSFATGHLMYFIGIYNFYNFTIPNLALGVAIGVVFAVLIMFGISKMMKLKFGNFFWQSFIYSFILAFMATVSIIATISNIKALLFAIGIILILISDLVLSTMYYGGKEKNAFMCILNHSLYYLGQIAIAGFLFTLI